jgi:hypothetical protein
MPLLDWGRLDRDDDGDGVHTGADNCPFDANPDQADADGDWIGDACDGCPGIPNRDWEDIWRDTFGW